MAPLAATILWYESHGVASTRGQLLMLDAFMPDLAGRIPAYLHKYEYSYSPTQGFAAWIVESHQRPTNTNPPDQIPSGIAFPTNFTVLPDESAVIQDMFSLWVSDASLEGWRIGVISPEFGETPTTPP